MGLYIKAIRAKVFFPAIMPFLGFCLAFIYDPEKNLSLLKNIQKFILSSFDWLFLLVVFLMLVACLVTYLSPLANMKLGDDETKPIFSKWNWFQVSLCTTLASGFVFWGSAEPLLHLSSPLANSVHNAMQKDIISLSIVIFHWSFTPYAIYTIPSIMIAISIHKFHNPTSLSYSLSHILGLKLTKRLASLIDSTCLFTLVCGFSASLGLGIIMISGALQSILGIDKSPLVYAIISFFIVFFFVISSISGISRGIKYLSQINMHLMLAILLFLFVCGPIYFIINVGSQSFYHSFSNIYNLGFFTFAEEQRAWSQKWTVFYWSSWLAWAPSSSIFLAKIARGYTVRDMIKISFFYPSIFVCIWLSILGGSCLYINSQTGTELISLLNTKGPEIIAYELLNHFPLASISKCILFITIFLSFVTAADSSTDVMSEMSCFKHKVINVNSLTYLKIFWGIFTGILAWSMITYSNIDGLRILSNIGGFPVVIICFVFLLNLVVLLRKNF